ncbi:unnamed protein product, partial [Onchocerca flexuosa]|uniref:Uncharacterized protein n=1 Tax=Onchocerca flexuosa TaxID=387005 RepID=A0A183I7X4_9BILA
MFNKRNLIIFPVSASYCGIESTPSSSVCRISGTQRDSSTRLQETATSSRVIVAPPGSSATLQPNSKHRETTFGIDEDCWRSSGTAMFTNGKPQLASGSSSTTTSAATTIHRLSGINGHQSVCRKSTNSTSNVSVSNGFASGSTVNRFVPNGSIGGSPLRGHSPRTVSNSKLQNGGSPRSSLA